MAAQTIQRSHPGRMRRHTAASTSVSKVKGSTNFHAKFINWSCLRRGSVPRSQIITQIESITLEKNQIQEGTNSRNDNGADHPPRKSVVPSPEIENIPRYSPRKKSANL